MSKVIQIFKENKLLVKAKVYANILLLAKGLRFSSPLQKGQALLLASSKEDLATIDMLFVFFPIDAIWLDKNKRITHIVHNIQPFMLAVTPPRKAQYILECQAGSTYMLKNNQKLIFKV